MSVELVGNRYLIHREIGEGGMGIVYEVTDRLTRQRVALKKVTVPSRHLKFASVSDTDDVRLSLAQEFKILASIRHPHVISVLDYGFDSQRQPFYTMELLHDSRSILDAGKNTSIKTRVKMIIQLLQALSYLHRRGIIHRDLKPGNVQVIADDYVKVLDFGLAMGREHLQERGDSETTAGTIAYMAPELLKGNFASEASDLYAVGVIAYQLIAGRHPFDTNSIPKLIAAIVSENPDLSVLDEGTTRPSLHTATPDEKTALLPDEATAILKNNLIDEDTEDDTRATIDKLTHHNEEATHLKEPFGAVVTSPMAMIIGRLLAKNPEERYRDIRQVILDLCEAAALEVPPETEAIRESYLQAARFVGRENEFEQLNTALDTTLKGTGSGWLIGGESGVGKSRLVDELRTQALVQGALVLRGQAISEGSAPYGIWREVLRHLILQTSLSDLEASVLKLLIPDMPLLLERDIPDAPELDLQSAQGRLVRVIEDLFRRQTMPLVVILEDLQWAHEGLAILRRLSQITPELALLLVGNYRDDERPDLPNDLPAMQTIKLSRLDQRAIADLSASMLGEVIGRKPDVIELLERETEGNVFFIVEVVRTLAEEAGQLDDIGMMTLPQHVFAEGMQTVVSRRLARVAPDHRQLLQVAAVAGRQLDPRVLTVYLQNTPDLRHLNLERWLTACANVAVLDVLDDHWRFVHDKLREGLVTEVTDKVGVNLRLAEAIERVYPDDPTQYTKLALHWRVVGNGEKEAHYARLAGKQNITVGAYSDAVEFLERAVALIPTLNLPKLEQGEVTYLLGEAYYGQGRLIESHESLVKGLELLGRKHPATKAALGVRLLRQAGRQFWHRLTLERRTGHQVSNAEGSRLQMAALACERLEQIHYFRNEKVPTLYYVLQGLNLAERGGAYTYAETARFYASASAAFGFAPQHNLAEMYGRRADKIVEQIHDQNTISWVSELRGVYTSGRGQWTKAESFLHRCVNEAESSGDLRRWKEGVALLSYAYHFQGKWDDESNLLDELFDSVTRWEDVQVRTITRVAQSSNSLRRGNLDEALWRIQDSHTKLEELTDLNNSIRAFGLLTQVQWRLGNFDEASKHAKDTARLVGKTPPTAYFMLEGYAGVTEFYLMQWEQTRSAEHAVEAKAHLPNIKRFAKIFDIGRPRSHTFHAWYYFLAGEREKAEKAGAFAIAEAQRLQMPYEEGLAYYTLGRFAPDIHQDHLHQAIDIFKRLGATYDLGEALKV